MPSASPSPPAADTVAPEQPGPPSPVPTEIITPEPTQEEIVADIQHSGVRVRDFAYEPALPPHNHAAELFDPILAWHVYEAMLDNPSPARNPLNARHLRRLIDLGWVDERTDAPRWLPKDRDALHAFDSRPHYPWKALDLPQPPREDLREVAMSRFQWINAEQLVPPFVGRALPRLTAVLRAPRAAARFQKRPVSDDPPQSESDDPDTSPRIKKRRLSAAKEPARQPAPSPPAHVPLTLVNGKPPQQFPAGRPSDSPPRSTSSTLPTQGALSRSLQRHLSMASITSACATDLARSDPRTTLAQGANHD